MIIKIKDLKYLYQMYWIYYCQIFFVQKVESSKETRRSQGGWETRQGPVTANEKETSLNVNPSQVGTLSFLRQPPRRLVVSFSLLGNVYRLLRLHRFLLPLQKQFAVGCYMKVLPIVSFNLKLKNLIQNVTFYFWWRKLKILFFPERKIWTALGALQLRFYSGTYFATINFNLWYKIYIIHKLDYFLDICVSKVRDISI